MSLSKQAEMMEAKGWMLASTAAERLGVHITTIYRWIDGGKVEGTGPSHRRYVKVASLIAKEPALAEAAGLVAVVL